MQKTYILSFSILISLAFFALKASNFSPISVSSRQPLNSGGAGAGKTGAPGEQNCTACHAGTAQDGTNENILVVLDGTSPVTSYVPGQQYTVTLSMSSNPTKKGFQATALTSANTMAGDFSAGSNTQINTGNNRKYANHTISSNSGSTTSWSWDWIAPVSGSGDVTFYVASNKANNNGADSGDLISLSQHTFVEQSSSSLEENAFNHQLLVYWDEWSNSINISFELNASSKIGVNIVDASGKSVYNTSEVDGEIGANLLQLPLFSMESGIYFVNIFVDNKPLSKKVLIP